VIVPQKEIASTWCAFGAASADILHVYEQVDIQASPFDAARVNASLEALEKRRANRWTATASPGRGGTISSRSTCATRARSTSSR